MKRSSKIAIIILVIIVTFSLGTVGGYLLFKGKYNSSKNDTQVNDTNKNNNINNNNESKLEKLFLTNPFKSALNFL